MKKNILFPLLLVALALFLIRFSNLPANITPMIAVSVLAHRYISNQILSISLILTVMVASDLLIGFYSEAFITYFLIGVFVLLGSYLKRDYLSGLLAVLIWHITINATVYLGSHGAETLTDTYLQAIIFDARLLTSTLFFIALFRLIESQSDARQQKQGA
jgi:hypothetical protein